MAARKVKVGDLVSHDGNWAGVEHENGDFEVTSIAKGKVVFENERFRVVCAAKELQWLEEDGAFYLPGRLLTREQRNTYQELMGSAPRIDMHVAARGILEAHTAAQGG